MKTKLLFIALLFAGLLSQAQTNKTITVTIKDFGEACGQDAGDAIFCLADDKGNPIAERYSCNYANEKWEVEPKDLITKDWTLNSKYKNKKAVLHCTKNAGGAGWVVEKVEFDNANASTINQTQADSFAKATCKIYHPDKGLINICENQTIFDVYKGNKEKNGKAIQNKNEICKGKNCIRVKIDKSGFIQIWNLPNVTDSRIVGKIEGDKIYSCKADGTQLILHATFKGDKGQAALIAVEQSFFK